MEKECLICGEDNYNVLDVHRIEYGSQGGTYTKRNTIVVCTTCHRRIHAGEIEIDGKYNSTKGLMVHYFVEGKEYWK